MHVLAEALALMTTENAHVPGHSEALNANSKIALEIVEPQARLLARVTQESVCAKILRGGMNANTSVAQLTVMVLVENAIETTVNASAKWVTLVKLARRPKGAPPRNHCTRTV
jgi:hypothetical protein